MQKHVQAKAKMYGGCCLEKYWHGAADVCFSKKLFYSAIEFINDKWYEECKQSHHDSCDIKVFCPLTTALTVTPKMWTHFNKEVKLKDDYNCISKVFYCCPREILIKLNVSCWWVLWGPKTTVGSFHEPEDKANGSHKAHHDINSLRFSLTPFPLSVVFRETCVSRE